MTRKLKPISILRRDIINSIQRPDFILKNGKAVTINDLSWNYTYEMLIYIMDCISVVKLSDKALSTIINEVDKIANQLDNIMAERNLVYIWIWIYGLLQTWLEWAVERDEFETATNLNKLLNIIYNNNVEGYDK